MLEEGEHPSSGSTTGHCSHPWQSKTLDAVDKETQDALSKLMESLKVTSVDIMDLCSVQDLQVLDPVQDKFTEDPMTCPDEKPEEKEE